MIEARHPSIIYIIDNNKIVIDISILWKYLNSKIKYSDIYSDIYGILVLVEEQSKWNYLMK